MCDQIKNNIRFDYRYWLRCVVVANAFIFVFNLQRSILEQQIKQKRQQAPHIRASDLQILRSDGNKEATHAYNGNLFINSCGFFWGMRDINKWLLKWLSVFKDIFLLVTLNRFTAEVEQLTRLNFFCRKFKF